MMDKEEEGEIECAICAIEFENEEKVIQLACDERHIYHKPCIHSWIARSKEIPRCPLCRHAI